MCKASLVLSVQSVVTLLCTYSHLRLCHTADYVPHVKVLTLLAVPQAKLAECRPNWLNTGQIG